jgi:23S rRNA (cytidine1920-2'-O)/16S rRNA (cytidine1409-2'-O)-methyltransferase
LVRRGLVASREQARDLIGRGAVLVGGAVADKAARLVGAGDPIVVDSGARPFVSRGGDKLDDALARLDVSIAGRRCLDAGASTGGFTDCLLQRGAAHVVAVDVGYGQLHPDLRGDDRVTVHERTNVRHLSADDIGGPVSVVVADLSFVSLATVVPVLAGDLAAPGADLVVLVKPQFEVGRAEVSRGRGVVRDPGARRAALEKVASALTAAGATIMGAVASPLLGPAGNAEYFLRARAHTPSTAGPDLATMLDAAVAESPDTPPPEASVPAAPGER